MGEASASSIFCVLFCPILLGQDFVMVIPLAVWGRAFLGFILRLAPARCLRSASGKMIQWMLKNDCNLAGKIIDDCPLGGSIGRRLLFNCWGGAIPSPVRTRENEKEEDYVSRLSDYRNLLNTEEEIKTA